MRTSSKLFVVLAASASAAPACTDEFPLGSWNAVAGAGNTGAAGSEGTAGTGTGGVAGTEAVGGSDGVAGTESLGGEGGMGGTEGIAGTAGSAGTMSAGTAGTAGSTAEFPQCLQRGTPGARNTPNASAGTTDTVTNFAWPTPVDSIEFELMIERENPTNGYYWALQFALEGGNAGWFGLQAGGGYQTEVGGPIDFTKMAVFWLSGMPVTMGELDSVAALGDIEEPDARVLPATQAGLNWITIHGRYAWEACRLYRLRVALHSVEETGERWYGTWVADVEADEETVLGRIRVPEESGRLNIASNFRTTRIDYVPPASCAEPEPSSALFGLPTANGGTVHPVFITNRFGVLRCATSRFTEFPAAIRHELGLDG